MTRKLILTGDDVLAQGKRILGELAKFFPNRESITLYGVPRGGEEALRYVLAGKAQSDFWRQREINVVGKPEEADAFIDDLIDSGKTYDEYHDRYAGIPFFALFNKAKMGDFWVVFPWELERGEGEEEGPADAVRRILQFIGENPDREGLRDTPKRVLKAWREMTGGYGVDVDEILLRTFSVNDSAVGVDYDQIIISRRIRFSSVCEHHLLPFVGIADVAYLPGSRVVGLSKLSRVVEAYARRLQIQERMTAQIAHAIQLSLAPRGVAVIVRAKHMCMGCRGVLQPDSDMVTSAMLGCFREHGEVRSEVLRLVDI